MNCNLYRSTDSNRIVIELSSTSKKFIHETRRNEWLIGSIRNIHFDWFQGYTINIVMSANKSTLFLGDLSAFCNEQDIYNLFRPYGNILEVKIMRSEETSRNLSYGFIKFLNPVHANQAMVSLNGQLFCGRNLRFLLLCINNLFSLIWFYL